MSARDLPAYEGYAYSYPHKLAYRELEPPVPLREAWLREDKRSLFLYLHVPFCEMRCSFCNLFARSQPASVEVDRYLAAVERQAKRVGLALGRATFARMAVGGGTPTFLGAAGLGRLLDAVENALGVDALRVPTSVETSPGTSSPEVLSLLRSRGVRRISLGVQSFREEELRQIGRPADPAEALAALERIRRHGPPELNVDLMYGLPGQTEETFRGSLDAALQFRPEELYLYPLYVRELTTLARRASADDGHRLAMYRVGREFLREAGYAQESMRLFRRESASQVSSPEYSCQDDGMVGLGCGARSYTRDLHYADRYAVTPGAVRGILEEWMSCPEKRFDVAAFGIRLSVAEQKRRWVLKSLLRAKGFGVHPYRERFGVEVFEDFACLEELVEDGLAVPCREGLQLTAEGLERSDALGPWLYSDEVRELMARAARR